MRFMLAVAAFCTVSAAQLASADDSCTADEREAMRQAMLEPVARGDNTVYMKCSTTLKPGDKVTRFVRFYGDSADGVTLDCAGATIDGGSGARCKSGEDAGMSCSRDSDCDGGSEGICASPRESIMVDVSSKLYLVDGKLQKNEDGLYKRDRPEGVTVKRCNILGGVHVRGLGAIGQSEHVKTSSHDFAAPGHVARARDAAPTRVTFDDVTVTPSAPRIAIYLGPGTSYFTLSRSELNGSGNLAMYMDAESYKNTIERNYIHTKTPKREQLAVDGSSSNLIVANTFHELDDGGIYVYRNCGEDGSTRYSWPTYNQIINNNFYYANYTGSEGAVRLGARDASSDYCHLDDDYEIGYTSADSNWDFARYTAVMQNRVVRRPHTEMIQTRHSAINSPNYIEYNETVSETPSRKSGCFIPGGYVSKFLLHGQSAPVIEGDDDAPKCFIKACDDGKLSNAGVCAVRTVDFECKKSGSNSGCSGEVKCPTVPDMINGHLVWVPSHIGAVRAACDLEDAAVSNAQLATARPGWMKVTSASDDPYDGKCQVGSTQIFKASAYIHGKPGATSTDFGCAEHDQNGGDCQIRGTLYCYH